MNPRWASLDEFDRATFSTARAFLNGRLEEQATIDWALRLQPTDAINRLVLLELIDSPDGRKIGEPWQSAWRLLEESWNHLVADKQASGGAYQAKRRLSTGDRSGSLVSAITATVTPRLTVAPFSDFQLRFQKRAKIPKRVEDLFSTSLTSGEILSPADLGLDTLTDSTFLLSLARSLDSAVVEGLDIARRIGWDGEHSMWRLGQLHRVYYVPPEQQLDGEDEPDRFHRGIAPSVKLLHAVVSRLSHIDLNGAVDFVRRWKITGTPVHLRLWAALSRDPRIAEADEVAAFLLSLSDTCFWDLNNYPEIAELRAIRFSALDSRQQSELTLRIRTGPPRSHWPRKADAETVARGSRYWAARELRRIVVAGGVVSPDDKTWLDGLIGQFDDVAHMTRIDHDFLSSYRARFIPPNPDSRYNSLTSQERLSALEAALHSAPRGWDDDPARRAQDWISQSGNPLQIIVDLECLPDGGGSFPAVWEQFGWTHSPTLRPGKDGPQRDLRTEAVRVLSLLARLPEGAVRQAIRGISHWVSAWEKYVVTAPEGLIVWLKLWPIAIDATNLKQPDEEQILLDTAAHSSNDDQRMDHDSLNTPAGMLVGVFLMACRKIERDGRSFADGSVELSMRTAMQAAIGPAGSIVKYRLIQQMPYFLNVDELWTMDNLVQPLLEDSVDAQTLWRAVAQQELSLEVMRVLGRAMADRAGDNRLDRDTRRSLVFKVVVECLHAFKDQRESSVPHNDIQQMIRSVDDEVRAHGAKAVTRFVSDVSASWEAKPAEQLFLSAAAPFLRKVWPQERSLATPGVSGALADLPATAEKVFVEAVKTIQRFLVPFDCWSLMEYGLYGNEEGKPSLSIIDSREKAAALLRLLDLTIGAAAGSVIPYDLADALDQIRQQAPILTEHQEFLRLATAARRI